MFSPPLKWILKIYKWKCPNNYDRILSDIFGNYMELPPVEKRKNHYPHLLYLEMKTKEQNYEKERCFLEYIGQRMFAANSYCFY